jgi:hypothetical protein
MRSLRVDLQAGFDGDRVSLSIDGREVYARDDVRTDYSIGLADTVEAAVPGGEVRITLELPDRGLRESLVLPDPGSSVGFSIEPDGRITHRISPDTPRYL